MKSVKESSLVLTSYNPTKIKATVKIISENAHRFNIIIKIPAMDLTSSMVKKQPKIWGCESTDLERKIICLSGDMEDLKKLIKINTPNGVQMELFSKLV